MWFVVAALAGILWFVLRRPAVPRSPVAGEIDHCAWFEGSHGQVTDLEIWPGKHRDRRFARLPCDPAARHRLAACLLRAWLVPHGKIEGRGHLWSDGAQAGRDDIVALMRQACDFVKEPTLVVFTDDPKYAEWRALCEPLAPIEEMTEVAWARHCASGLYSRTPFGAELMRKVAKRLQQEPGGVAFGHRDYCGHGLRFKNGQFELCPVDDGDLRTALATWASEDAFVDCWSLLSDFACSGADESAPGFLLADSVWDLGNQRIDRERLLAFIS